MPLMTVRVDMEATLREFKGIHDDQLPFACVLALKELVKDGQAAVQKELPLRFTIRRLAWAKQGIKMTFATKENLQAIVEDIHTYMNLQEEGGTKLPTHGRWICVPIMGGARRSKNWLIRAEDMPKALMASGFGFIRGNVMYKRGADYKRAKSYMKVLGPGAAMTGTARAKITPMYALVTQASVPKRYGFEDIVRVVVEQMWPREFEKGFARAVRTSTR